MDFTSQQEHLKLLRKEWDRAQNAWRTAQSHLEKEVVAVFKTAWAKRFPRWRGAALPSSGDNALIFLYHVDGIKFLEGGGWGKQDNWDESCFGVPTKGPFPFEELEAFIRDVERDNPGLVVSPVHLKRRVKVEHVRSFRAIEKLHEGKDVQFVSQRKVRYEGWDIADDFIIVTIDGVQWAWWSSDAHGGPLRNSAQEGTPEWERFENFRAQGTVR